MVTKTSGSLCISLDTARFSARPVASRKLFQDFGKHLEFDLTQILRNANKHGVLLQHRRR